MKSILKNAILLLLFFMTITVSAQEKKTVQTAVIKTTIYCDHCKACETCGPQFNKLLKVRGVQMVTLDEKTMTLKVTYNSKKTDLTTIKQAISKLGYDADDVKADKEAYASLDGCCKKG